MERRLRQKCDKCLEVVTLESKGKAVLAVRNFRMDVLVWLLNYSWNDLSSSQKENCMAKMSYSG